MKTKTGWKQQHKKLISWIETDPEKRKKTLVECVPVKKTTLRLVVRGHYKPSQMMRNMIQVVMDQNP